MQDGLFYACIQVQIVMSLQTDCIPLVGLFLCDWQLHTSNDDFETRFLRCAQPGSEGKY